MAVRGVVSSASSSTAIPAFAAINSADQSSVTTATLTLVTVAETLDTDGWFASNRFTPQTAGWYELSGTVGMTGTLLSRCLLQFRKNGVATSPYVAVLNFAAATTFQTITGSMMMQFNGTTDYVEMFARGDVGSGTVTFYGTAPDNAMFSGAFVHS